MSSSAESSSLIPRKPRSRLWLWIALYLGLLWWIAVRLDVTFTSLATVYPDLIEYLSRYGHPDFSELGKQLLLMGETVALALWGTFLAFMAALLFAPLAARNLSPNTWCYRIAREMFSLMRAVPDLVLTILLVAALGLGPLPGVLALGVHTTGFLGKFFSESMERVQPGIYEAVASSGTSFPQIVAFAGWPSVLSEIAGQTLYVFDRNVRMASVLGLVGAGGIGTALQVSLELFNYRQASALIIVILVTLIAADYASGWLRRKLA
jgi:phosphonate transport system permease protein